LLVNETWLAQSEVKSRRLVTFSDETCETAIGVIALCTKTSIACWCWQFKQHIPGLPSFSFVLKFGLVQKKFGLTLET